MSSLPVALMMLLLAGAPPGTKSKPGPKKPAKQMTRNPVLMAAYFAAAAGEDPQARKTAYLNLSKVGVEKRVPDAQPDDPEPRCIELPSSMATCKAKVFICTRAEEVDTPESHYYDNDRYVGFGTTRQLALGDLADHLVYRNLRNGRDTVDTNCNVVFLDACALRIGMVCTTAVDKVGSASSAPPTTEAFDLAIK